MKELGETNFTGKTIKGNYEYSERVLTFNIIEQDINSEIDVTLEANLHTNYYTSAGSDITRIYSIIDEYAYE